MIFPTDDQKLLILAIINDSTDGLSGYSIVKKIHELFSPLWTPGPGTIYPKLSQLIEDQTVDKQDNKYTITDAGRDYIAKQIPATLNRSMDFLPNFFKTLIGPIKGQIPIDVKYYSRRTPCYMGSHFGGLPVSDEWKLEDLEHLRQELVSEKARANDWFTEYQAQLDGDIQKLGEEIQELKEKTKKIDVNVIWE